MRCAWTRAAASGSSARPAPAGARKTAAPAISRDAGSSQPLWYLLIMAVTSVGKPQQQVHGVVVGSVAPDPVVVAAAAVELVVGDVLRRDLHVQPRHVVDLRDPAARIGRAVGADDHAWIGPGRERHRGRIEAGIGAARGREVAQGAADLAPIVIGGP